MRTKKVSRRRHLVKAFTWRIVASLTTFLIGWIATGDIAIGISIGSADFFIKIVLYYLHERVWYKSNFGITKTSSSETEKSTEIPV